MQDLLSHSDFIKGEVNTRFVEEDFLPFWKAKDVDSLDSSIISAIYSAFKKTQFILDEDSNNLKQELDPWRYFFNEKN